MNKGALRKELIRKRQCVADRTRKDCAIVGNVLSLSEYREASTVLCYLSLRDEVQTEALIRAAWNDGKSVAVPCCTDDTSMVFYLIEDFDSLLTGTFGVREPDPSVHKKLTDFYGSLCIVPGLAFTKTGCRIGYGKGYYDKFLQNYAFHSVGLCYNSLILEELPIELHDISMDIVVTDKYIFGGNYGRI